MDFWIFVVVVDIHTIFFRENANPVLFSLWPTQASRTPRSSSSTQSYSRKTARLETPSHPTSALSATGTDAQTAMKDNLTTLENRAATAELLTCRNNGSWERLSMARSLVIWKTGDGTHPSPPRIPPPLPPSPTNANAVDLWNLDTIAKRFFDIIWLVFVL